VFVQEIMKLVDPLRGSRGNLVHSREMGAESVPSDVSEFVLEVICKCFKLRPVAQWKSSLAFEFIPTAARRLWMVDTKAVRGLVERLRKGEASSSDHFYAGWNLIFDAWCHTFQYSWDGAGSLPELVSLTQDRMAPAVRIARAIRDLAYGDKEHPDIFLQLAKDPGCEAVFRRSGWLNKPSARHSATSKRVSKSLSRRRQLSASGILDSGPESGEVEQQIEPSSFITPKKGA
jgi:hypothetical protein